MSDLIQKYSIITYQEKKYKIEFNNYSMIVLEDISGLMIDDYYKNLSGGHCKMKDLYSFLYAGLWLHHEMEFKDVVNTFNMDSFEEITPALVKAFNAYFPSKKK